MRETNPAQSIRQTVDLSRAMKMGMRRLASGVSVLSARTDSGDCLAITMSSVTSVSDDPPSLLVCLNTQLWGEAYLAQQGARFAINLLSSKHQAVSNLCAGFEGDKPRFEVGNWVRGANGPPILSDAQAVFQCETDKVMTYGTHHILVGRIIEVDLGRDEVDPLVYFDGDYRLLNSD